MAPDHHQLTQREHGRPGILILNHAEHLEIVLGAGQSGKMLNADAELVNDLWLVEIEMHYFVGVLDPQPCILAFSVQVVLKSPSLFPGLDKQLPKIAYQAEFAAPACDVV